MPNAPEVWLRGPVAGVPTALQPVAHAVLQALEDVERLTASLDPAAVWTSTGAATIGFHLRHMAGSLDRLLTYARGVPLSDAQRATLASEKQVTPEVTADPLCKELRQVVERALAQLRSTNEAELDEPRTVGQAALPSTVRGLLHHAAEHTARHAGQISTTVRVLQAAQARDRIP